jgi:hypothetical protein
VHCVSKVKSSNFKADEARTVLQVTSYVVMRFLEAGLKSLSSSHLDSYTCFINNSLIPFEKVTVAFSCHQKKPLLLFPLFFLSISDSVIVITF